MQFRKFLASIVLVSTVFLLASCNQSLNGDFIQLSTQATYLDTKSQLDVEPLEDVIIIFPVAELKWEWSAHFAGEPL